MVEGIELDVELKWINKRKEKLQQALLQMETDHVALGTQITQGKKELEALRAREIRLTAQLEEEAKKNESDVSGKAE